MNGIPNGTYTLTAFVRSSGGQNSARMEVSALVGNNHGVNIPASADWVKLVISNISITNGKCTINFNSDAKAYQWIHFDDVQLIRVILTSLEESSIEDIKVFPTLTTDNLDIDLPEGKGTYNVDIYNVLGNKIYSVSSERSMNVSLIGNKPGVYHVKIVNSGKLVSRRIVME